MTDPTQKTSHPRLNSLFPFSMRTLVILIIVGFIILLAMSLQRDSTSILIGTTTPVPLISTSSLSANPDQTSEVIQSNPDQTTGLILGAALLLFIIIVGTLSVIRRKA